MNVKSKIKGLIFLIYLLFFKKLALAFMALILRVHYKFKSE